MSVIIAVTRNGRTVMCADTLTTFGDSQKVPAENLATLKIRRLGSSIVGAAGWAVYDCIVRDYLGERVPELETEGQIFAFFMDLWRVMHDKYSFVNDQAQSKDSPFGDLDSSFILANRNGIFKVSPDMDVSRFGQFFAIGSGAEYAMGAVHALYATVESAEELARRGVATASQFDVFCGGEPTLLEVE